MRIRALSIRILRQFFRDKRTLALMFAAPVFILWMMSLVFNGHEYHPKLGAVDLPDPFIVKLAEQQAEVETYTTPDAEIALQKREIDAIIRFENGRLRVKLEGSDPTVNKSILMLLQNTAELLVPEQQLLLKPEITYLHGSAQMAPFDNFGPVLVGYFTFFFVFLIAGVSFLRERTGGTLERLLATPLRRWEIVCGYVLGFGIFTLVQACLIAWFAIDILGLMMSGSFLYVLLITLLLAMTALTLGTFLSAFANNELQMIQFIPLVIVPQIFFSGLFNMDTMVEWLRWLSIFMPLTYGAEALRNIMIRGQGWNEIAMDVYILLAFTAAFMFANVLALKKHRRI